MSSLTLVEHREIKDREFESAVFRRQVRWSASVTGKNQMIPTGCG